LKQSTRSANGAQAPGRKFLFEWRAAISSKDSGLSANSRHVALVLSLHMDERGCSCFPSLKTLAEETHRSKSTVVAAINELEGAGYLEVERGSPGRGRVSHYRALGKGLAVKPFVAEKRSEKRSPKDGEKVSNESRKGLEAVPEDVLLGRTTRGRTTSSNARAREDEEEQTSPVNERTPGAVAKVGTEDTPKDPVHALSGLGDISSFVTTGSDGGRSGGRATATAVVAEPEEADRVRALLQTLGYSTAVVSEVIRRLHPDVRNPVAWAETIAPEVEREEAASRARRAGLGARADAALDDYRDNQRRVAEERERGFQKPDWRKALEVVG
jgi:DNA-binding MarR family transcriptional regulator